MDASKQQDPRPVDQNELVAGVVVRSNLSARLIIGLVIIGIGVLLFLGSLGVIDFTFREVLRSWPAILVAVGLVKIFSRVGAATRVFGAVIATLGTLLLLDKFHYLDFDWKLMGPIALMSFGVIIVWRALAGGRARGAAETDASATLNTVAIMGGVNRKNTSQAFHGGEVTAVMGGAEIDLTQATPVPEGAVLELFAMWGGIEITVSGDWTVENRVTPLMGGSEDTRKVLGTDGKKRLILKGLAVMGGVEVKN